MHIKTFFFQYYAMKSKNLELLIIDLNNIHGYNRLKYTLWILSIWMAYFTMLMPNFQKSTELS
jgi:hypothetical protein